MEDSLVITKGVLYTINGFHYVDVHNARTGKEALVKFLVDSEVPYNSIEFVCAKKNSIGDLKYTFEVGVVVSKFGVLV